MKHISDLTSSTSHQQSDTASTNPFNDKAKRTIQELFVVMKASWGNKYTSQFTTPEDVRLAMRLWLQEFHSNDRDILHQALAVLSKKLEWPPSIKEMNDQVRLIEKERANLAALKLPAPKRPKHTKVSLTELEKIRKIVGKSEV